MAAAAPERSWSTIVASAEADGVRHVFRIGSGGVGAAAIDRGVPEVVQAGRDSGGAVAGLRIRPIEAAAFQAGRDRRGS